MRVFCAFLFIALCGKSAALAAGVPSAKEVGLCEVVNNVDRYDDTLVAFGALAEAALHRFEIALSDETCARNVFLRADPKFEEDKAFMSMMKQLYPGYPNDDGYTEKKVRVAVVGKITRGKNHGLLMTYLELESINLRE